MFENQEKGIKSFLKKNGLIIALVVFLLAVGAVAFFTAGGAQQDEGQDVQNQQAPRLEDEIGAIRASQSPRPSTSAAPTASPAPSPSAAPAPSPSASGRSRAKASVKMTMPLKGEIIKAFSGETLVYNATLETWMTHNGIDIAAADDAEVVALAGTVESVEEDPTRGVVVTIAHSGGKKTVYAGLSECAVKQGDKVNAAQKLGRAGTPAFEAREGAHLHFEVLVDGKYVDPAGELA